MRLVAYGTNGLVATLGTTCKQIQHSASRHAEAKSKEMTYINAQRALAVHSKVVARRSPLVDRVRAAVRMHPVPLHVHAPVGCDPEARADRRDGGRVRLPVRSVVDPAADDLAAVRVIRPTDVRGPRERDRGVVHGDGLVPVVVVVVLAGDDALAEGHGDDDGQDG